MWSQDLTISQKGINGINCFFACWYKFRKAKSWFNDFWVAMIRNGHGLLVYDTLKSAVSWEWIFELSWLCWGQLQLYFLLFLFFHFYSILSQWPKGQEWLGWVERLNKNLYSMKLSIDSMKLDILSCSSSFCLASCVGPDSSKDRGVWRALALESKLILDRWSSRIMF